MKDALEILQKHLKSEADDVFEYSQTIRYFEEKISKLERELEDLYHEKNLNVSRMRNSDERADLLKAIMEEIAQGIIEQPYHDDHENDIKPVCLGVTAGIWYKEEDDLPLGVHGCDCGHDCQCCDHFADQDDSDILSVNDLAKTIDIEDKSPEMVMNELVIITDEYIEEAISWAILDYAVNKDKTHHGRFFVRTFIEHLEALLNDDASVIDVDYHTAVETLDSCKSIKKVYEGVYERLN